MPKRSSSRDINQLAAQIVGAAAGLPNKQRRIKKNAAAVALGRLGGKKGGPARARKLSAKERKAIAKLAARTRWGVER